MSALEELRAGIPGPATLALVMRAASRALRAFPPREGYGGWTEDAVAEEVSVVFEQRPFLLSKALIAGVDSEEKLEAYLRTAVANAMKDQAKSTDVGKLRRRLVNVLGSDDRFVHSTAAGESWVLAGFEGRAWTGDLVPLQRAAARMRGVFIEKLNPAGPTPAPVRDALQAVAATVLAEARAAVLAQDLAHVVFDRLFPSGHPMHYLDAPGGHTITDPRPGPESAVSTAAAARALFATLDDHERALLPHLGQTPLSRRGRLPGVGPRETEAIADALTTKIAQAVVDDAEAEQVVLALLDLLDLCRESSR